MRTAKVFMRIVIIAVIAMFTASTVFAGTTGKLRGKVVNKKTKEAIPSVPVQIAGTTMGALTDANGEYMIINVPPMMYSIVVKAVGFIQVTAEQVEVTVDHTTVQDFTIEETAIEVTGYTVTAQRDLLKISETQNVRQLTAESIKNMPVTTVQELLSIQVGVVKRGGQIHFRGGRSNEVTYVVDGVSIKDPLGGLGAVDQAMNISGNVIEDMQIIKGGFDAEYGNATSGIVTIATKTGSDVTTGHLAYYTDDFGTKILNGSSYNYDRLEFNISGRDPVLSEKVLPRLGINWFSDKLYYAISGAANKSDGYVNYKQYFTETTKRRFKERSILGLFNLEDRMSNDYEAQIKLRWQASPKIKVLANYRGSWNERTVFQWNYRYTPATAPIEREESAIYSLQLTHQLDKSTYYEFTLSHFNRGYLQKPGDPNNPGDGLNPDQFLQFDEWEYYYDRNNNGKFDSPEPFINVNGDTSWVWGGPFYTFGDAYVATPNTPIFTSRFPFGPTPWPAAHYQVGPTGSDNTPEYRGVDAGLQGWANSSSRVDTVLTDWNGNGRVDFYESEPFVDLNGDGKWNAGDYVLQDTNNNGSYDADRASVINVDSPEPFTDGDKVIGEPFIDVNLNGVYDEGIDIFRASPDPTLNMDLNRNSKYDGPNDPWSPGLRFQDLNGNGIYDRPNGIYNYGEPFFDKNKNGKWDSRDGFYDTGHQQWAFYQDRSAANYTADFKINKQFSKEHDVRSGVELKMHTIKMADLRYPFYPYDGTPDGGPYPTIGTFRDFYNRKPIAGAFFLQDKMEYGGMLANLGLRYDFFIQSSDLKQNLSADQAAGKSIAGSQNRFSPRVGFSYPISDVAKVFFNYAHFNQLPDLEYMYRRATQASNAFGIIGNENLDYSKTIQYEFGVSYLLSKDYVVDVSGFYKDIFGQVNSVREGSGPSQRNVYQNSDYARSRGFETELSKKYGNYVQGSFSYQYAFAYGKSSASNSNYLDDYYSRSIPIQEYPLIWDQRHAIAVNLDLRVPAKDHPKLFGMKLPDNWGVNFIWQFGSGFPFTPDRDYPGLRLMPGENPQSNSMRYPSTSNVDIRMNKRFPFLGLDYSVDLWIDNLFNKKNVELIYGLTGRYDTNSKTPGSNYVYQGSDISNDPARLGSGRNIKIGIGVDF
jgi:outer membrane receptor protein involved in Fe transport